jgi:cell wall assembly regulator SMI1
MVPELIARLDRWLATHRPDYYARLRPGVTDAELNEVESRFSLRLPEAFRLLYKWRNGHDDSKTQALQKNFRFMSLEDVVSTKQHCDDMIGNDFETPKWWRREWVPFLQNWGGDDMVVDLLGIDGGTPGQVVTFWHDDPVRPIRFPSMEAWLADLVESMESGSLELA